MANNAKGPRPLILCGPSGTGKSTLLKKLLEDYPNSFGFSVSHTTRLPRPGEIDGQHYHFTTLQEMKQAIEEGKFIESATFGGNMYGTSKAAVESVRSQGKVCVLDIDVQGVKQIKKTDLNPFYIFIKPPNLNVLEDRLRQRKTETEDTLKRRLSVASHEMKFGEEPGNFDLVVLNDNLEHAYEQLKKFVQNYVLNGAQENKEGN